MSGNTDDMKDPEEEIFSGSFHEKSQIEIGDINDDTEDIDSVEDDDEDSNNSSEPNESTKVEKREFIDTVTYRIKSAIAPSLDTQHEENQAEATVSREFDKQERKSREKSKQLEIENKGRSDYFSLRIQWSIFLLVTLSIMVLFQIFLTIAIGLNWLHYEKYKPFLELLVGETFLQVAGMCYIVVRCLFPGEKDDKKKPEKPERKTKD